MLPRLGHDDELVSARARHQVLNTSLCGGGGAYDCFGGHAFNVHLLRVGPDGVHIFHGRCERQIAAHHAQEMLLLGRVQVACSLVGIGEHCGCTHHDVGLFQVLGGLEVCAVGVYRLLQHCGRKMRSERVGQTQLCGKLRTEQGRTQNVQGHLRALAGNGVHAVHGGGLAQEALQLLHLGGEAHGGRIVAAQSGGGHRVGAGRTAHTQVNTAGVECVEGTELLRHHVGCVVGEHNAARTHANTLGCGSDLRHDHDGRRGQQGAGIVVLGDPETLVPVGLSRAGGIDGVEHGLVLALVGAVRHQVKHRNFYVGRHNFSF